MTIEQRLEQVEQQNQRIQRTNKRLTVALTMMAVTICAAVTMAATNMRDVSNSENGRYEFHWGNRTDSLRRDYLLDTATGDMWSLYKEDKKPVTLKR